MTQTIKTSKGLQKVLEELLDSCIQMPLAVHGLLVQIRLYAGRAFATPSRMWMKTRVYVVYSAQLNVVHLVFTFEAGPK